MSHSSKEAKLATLKKLQLYGPLSLIIIGALIYWLWDNDMSGFVGSIIAFLAIPDYLAFKFLANQLEY